jgi:2'-deoxynucleoside 5'-phosphate N-hydrolase
MNIYFSCSITGGREDQEMYRLLVESLLASGHEVPTAHLAWPDVMEQETRIDAREVYERDVAWVSGCDAVVAEVSTPSHGVGYEIALALSLGKPVLCCYQAGRRVSKMLLGNSQPAMQVCAYHTAEELLNVTYAFLNSLNGS